jgi:hypothetical protein
MRHSLRICREPIAARALFMIRVALAAGILPAAASCASAQHSIVRTAPDCRVIDGTVSFLKVTIRDATGSPLSGVHVRAARPANGSGDQTVDTDPMGRATLCLLDGGRWRIDAFGAGFTSLESDVSVMSGVSCTTSYTLQVRRTPSL